CSVCTASRRSTRFGERARTYRTVVLPNACSVRLGRYTGEVPLSFGLWQKCCGTSLCQQNLDALRLRTLCAIEEQLLRRSDRGLSLRHCPCIAPGVPARVDRPKLQGSARCRRRPHTLGVAKPGSQAEGEGAWKPARPPLRLHGCVGCKLGL